jgi:hypothetical protein
MSGPDSRPRPPLAAGMSAPAAMSPPLSVRPASSCLAPPGSEGSWAPLRPAARPSARVPACPSARVPACVPARPVRGTPGPVRRV